ncbi:MULTISPECIES: ATP-binding protein [unclassified Pseudomonas]|uniref:ATP-binding protein n=1 Tax=unclassified Pseudomonas TaxID=196821 RepID=UPI000BCF3F56|nr:MULTISPECIES: ATP-binding protein [unclassified Pseudomonas]PVZ10373.1 two-component system osmolarity sensor histidine kinase EnvZ [Pseudomonas sp. URIL14HWK12:I12]PVZ21799.1 two-component system osmolarity sensor histidine kinase EnvZ [Pseudomonas sp. URIL14HWK12:I10]PVZ31118.1 two-component system osmolarity sensor histidine kinase EnvZ [Pseudomonas sp. URIL14HWK12:I11]SNZ17785.1 Osmolarity sensor protein envZ [Pseudomonas sp. URIL14HWK12:I9]
MKAPVWFPQSFFARTLWLVLVAVLFSKALTLVYLLMNEDVLVDRQYSHGVGLTLRAYWAADEKNRERIADAAGLLRVAGTNVPQGEQHWPYSEIYQRQMQDELGEDTEVRLRVHAPPALWVRAPSLGPDWMKVPLYPHPLRGQKIWSVLGWFLAIGVLSTASAWIFVSQLIQPLKLLINAARELGKGRSVRLPISDQPNEMTEVYNAFNQMAEDVEQAGRERELMLAGVSHDLRTPLTRLRLSLAMIGERNEFADDMVRDIEDMDAILDQFMAFIRDGRDEALEEVDLSELVREVVAPFNQPEHRVNLALQPIPPVPLRRISIKRLLMNLVGNALYHGGQQVEVAAYVAGDSSAPYVVLSVLDRGEGLSEEELEGIFNPFTRGDRARSKGTGLGLAIVRRIVAMHGGTVELRNRDGGGLEARVRLPLNLMLPRDAV